VLRAKSEAGCDAVVAANRRFEGEHLKGFDGGCHEVVGKKIKET